MTSLLYRVHGAVAWQCGRVIDMSVTGLSWQSADPAPSLSASVDFIVPLIVLAGVAGPLVCGVGRVVRVTPLSADGPGAGVRVAVAIQESAMQPVPALERLARPATPRTRLAKAAVVP